MMDAFIHSQDVSSDAGCTVRTSNQMKDYFNRMSETFCLAIFKCASSAFVDVDQTWFYCIR